MGFTGVTTGLHVSNARGLGWGSSHPEPLRSIDTRPCSERLVRDGNLRDRIVGTYRGPICNDFASTFSILEGNCV